MAVNLHSGKVAPHARQVGFTYMGLLVVVAISGIAMGGLGIVWHHEVQREREIELKFIGKSYQNAIGSYYESQVNGVKQFPLKLEDLLLDERFQNVKRHIRKLYNDPILPSQPWGLVLEKGRIIGIYSQSTKVMVQQSSAKGVAKYSDLKFIYTPTAKATTNLSTSRTKKTPTETSENLSTGESGVVKPENTSESYPQIPELLNPESLNPETLNNVQTINGKPERKTN